MHCPCCNTSFAFTEVPDHDRRVNHFSTRFHCPRCHEALKTSKRYEVLTFVSFAIIIASIGTWFVSFFEAQHLRDFYVLAVTLAGIALFVFNAMTVKLSRDSNQNNSTTSRAQMADPPADET